MKPKLKAEAAPEMTRDKLTACLCAVIRPAVGHIDPNHPLAQPARREQIQRGEGDAILTHTTVKTPAKLEAVWQLVELSGWKASGRTEGELQIVIRRI